MIPYFIVLFMLALYGLHRYVLLYDSFAYRKNVPPTPPPVENWPKVTIQLPIFNERYVIERLVDAVAQFDYPHDLLDIQVLDDSTDETREVARACVERHAIRGLPVSYIHRTNREGFKAGALENGLRTAQGEFVAIFDADDIRRRFSAAYGAVFPDPQAKARSGWCSSLTYLNSDYSR
jgi:cellulose synthase/poly-beta-1,6-N-acetylglucosamine synthase-like glycosyltransferase